MGGRLTFDKKTVRTIVLLILFAVVLNAVVQHIDAVTGWIHWVLGILSPLLAGLGLAFVLNIPMSMLERRVFKPRGHRALAMQKRLVRPLSMLFSVLILIVIVVLVSVIVLPRFIDSVARIFSQLPAWVELARDEVQRFSTSMPELVSWIESLQFDWAGMQSSIMNFLRQGLGLTLGSVASVATSVFGTATSTAISLVFALSVLGSKEKLASQAERVIRAVLSPDRANRTIDIARISSRAFSGFVSGQVTEACILGSLCFLGMSIIGFPNAAVISTLVGIGAIVPILGAFVSALTGALLIAASEGIMRGVWFAVFFIILQQLEGNLIYPRVMGKRVGLPMLWVLAAITVGGGLMGVIGMIISIPIFAVLYTLSREAIHARLARTQAADSRGGTHHADTDHG